MHNLHIFQILLVYSIFLFWQFLTQLLVGGHFSFTIILSLSDQILRVFSLYIFLLDLLANFVIIGSLILKIVAGPVIHDI